MVSTTPYEGRSWAEADKCLTDAGRNRVRIMDETYMTRIDPDIREADDGLIIITFHKRMIISYHEFGVTRVYPGPEARESVRARLNRFTPGQFAWWHGQLRCLFRMARDGSRVTKEYSLASGRTTPTGVWDGMNVGPVSD